MKLSLATKIFLGFSLVLAVFGSVPIFGIAQLNAVREQLNTVNRAYLPLNRLAADIETLQETARRSTDSILRFDDMELQRSLLQNHRRSFDRNMLARFDQGRSILSRIRPEKLPERERRFLSDVGSRLDSIQTVTNEFVSSMDWILQSLEIQPVSADDLVGIRKTGRQLAREVRLLKLNLKNIIATQMLMVERDESSAIGVLIWLTILAMTVGLVVTILSLVALRPARRLAQAARQISEGDFSQILDISGRDEFGVLASEFNRMARSLAQREEQLVGQQEQLEVINREMRQTTIDLALMKRYSEHIIRSLHNGILVTDARSEVTTINPAAQKLWALEPEQAIGKRLEQLPIGKALQAITHSWESVLRDQQHKMFEAVEFQIAGRGQVLVDLYVSPLLGTDGDSQGVLLVGEDVTEKVRTKQALLQSERLATIGRMSAVVAHEIRNPLSSIGLNTELLQDEMDESENGSSEEARSILASISREVERLTEVTDEYLRFARLPKPSLHPENLNNIIEDLLRFMASELEEAGVRLEHQFDPKVGCVPADEGQLRQAFLNLFKNSAESMSAGGTLTVRTEQANGLTRIVVSDTGKGIDEGCLDKIFDPFFSTREGGTGLGLSLTQQIVSEHGGRISCNSSPGKGTSFVVELPACRPETAGA
jgi:PAS domain S-box-containing protein